jgi:hypothetical protein
VRRARILAFFLDWLVCAAAADLLGLVATWTIWRLLPGWRAAIPWVWAALAAGATAAFLLRDSAGGRARRWLALEAENPDGRPPGAWGSVRRNLPLLVPVWNLVDAWPVLRDGQAPRRCDRATGTRIVPIP